MCIIRQDLVGHGVDVVAILVLCDSQLNQVRALQRGSVDGIGPMLLDPWQNICEVEECSCRRANRVCKWLEGEGAEIEWQALERGVGTTLLRLGDSGASTGRESIFGCPLGVCDLEKIRLSAGIQDAI